MRRLAVAAAHGRTLTMRGLPEMLPGYEVRNALVDFSPITNAIDSNQHNALARRKLDIEQERTGLDRRRLTQGAFGRIAHVIQDAAIVLVDPQQILAGFHAQAITLGLAAGILDG